MQAVRGFGSNAHAQARGQFAEGGGQVQRVALAGKKDGLVVGGCTETIGHPLANRKTQDRQQQPARTRHPPPGTPTRGASRRPVVGGHLQCQEGDDHQGGGQFSAATCPQRSDPARGEHQIEDKAVDVKSVHAVDHPVGEQQHLNHPGQADQQDRQRDHPASARGTPGQESVQQIAGEQCRQQVEERVADRGCQRPQRHRKGAVGLLGGKHADVQGHPQSGKNEETVDTVARRQWVHRHPWG